MGQVRGGLRRQGADQEGQPRGSVARGREGARCRRRRHSDVDLARQGDDVRRQGVRSREPLRLSQEPVDQARRSLIARGPSRVDGPLLSGTELNPMNMPAIKTEPAVALPAGTAPKPDGGKILALKIPRPALNSRIVARLGAVARSVIPPVVVIACILLVWELVCRKAGSTLPPPSKVLSDTWELIADPFFDRGGLDKGLFWHLSASLQRVALGYALASVVGIALGTLVGQSVWAMRGLDPIFQVLRTVPPLAWLPLSLAAFRDGQPSAIFVIFITSIWPIIINTAVGIRNIPEDY